MRIYDNNKTIFLISLCLKNILFDDGNIRTRKCVRLRKYQSRLQVVIISTHKSIRFDVEYTKWSSMAL